MGRRICQFGIEHGRCRCVCPDKVIPCDVPEKHGGAEALKKWGEPEFSAGGLADGERIDQLTAALDAAQDEIEKSIEPERRSAPPPKPWIPMPDPDTKPDYPHAKPPAEEVRPPYVHCQPEPLGFRDGDRIRCTIGDKFIDAGKLGTIRGVRPARYGQLARAFVRWDDLCESIIAVTDFEVIQESA